MGVGRHQRSRDDWETPEHIYRPYADRYRIVLDVCANARNHKAPFWISKRENALIREWEGVWWMNPPYGRGIIGKWVQKAHQEAQAGRWGVALLPAFTGNGWWIDTVWRHYRQNVEWVRKRIHFVGARYNAPFWSAVVVFRACPQPIHLEERGC